MIVLQKKCIEPLGESKSDYEIFAGLAKRLGVYGAFTMGGKTELDWVKQIFHATDLPKVITWEEFEKKGYYVVPRARRGGPADAGAALVRRRTGRRTRPTGARTLATRCNGKGLQTTTGKIEFVASSLKRFEKTGTRRPRAPGHGPAVHRELGGPPHRRALRQVPAADGLAASAVQLPHHGRRQGQLD